MIALIRPAERIENVKTDLWPAACYKTRLTPSRFKKAHKDISSLLLQVLDEGCLTDAQGHRVDFRNTIIVMTTNLGADVLVKLDDAKHSGVGDGVISRQSKDAVMARVSTAFAPEFINRIDEFVFFRRLSRSSLRQIVYIRLRELQNRLEGRRITLRVEDDAIDWLVEASYDARYGARPLNRTISKKIGTKLADQIIRGEIKTGDLASVNVSKDGSTLDVKLDRQL